MGPLKKSMASIKYLLDTNILSEVINPSPSLSVMQRFAQHRQALAISTVTWHELNYGAHLMNDGRKKRNLQKYLSDAHIKFVWGKEALNNQSSIIPFYILEYESNYNYMPIVGSGDISKASAGIGDIPGEQHYLKDIVNLELKTEAQEKWCIFTTEHPGEQVAIVLDNILYMAPYINEPICGGGILVTGFENKYEANEIAGILQAGQLAAPMIELKNIFFEVD